VITSLPVHRSSRESPKEQSVKPLTIVFAILLLSSCASAVKVGDQSAKGPVSGAAAGGTAVGASSQLMRCEAPLGTLAVAEDSTQEWYQLLTTQYHLPSTTPLLRLLIQQSNCFVIVDRGRALELMRSERQIANQGELRPNSNMGKGQMVAADYTMTPSIQFAQQTGGGAAGAIAGLFSPVAGLVAGGMRKVEAATTLILVDGRSGVQVAVSEGVASKKDFSFGAIGGGGGAAVGLGAWQNTPQGKIIAGAFMDAFNQMVKAARSYTAQATGPRGLGTGGALAVDGASKSPPVAYLTVREAQAKLTKLGYYDGPIDKIIGKRTVAALSAFQRDNGLPVTGRLDSATMAALAK